MKKDSLIIFLHKNGKNPKDIAEQLKVTLNYVYKVIKIEGIRGYTSDVKNALYHTEEYKEMRRKVLERDGNKCTRCGSKGSKLNRLQINHKKAKATNIELIFDMSNLETLCARCHGKEPTTKIYRKLNKV